MHFWIIEEGKKAGPFEGYEVREMIRNGRVSEGTRVWHEGAETWLAAKEMSVLEGEFVEDEVVPPPLPIVMPPFLAWRRFGSRFFDYFLYQLVLVMVLRVAGFQMIPDQSSPGSAWLIVGGLLPAILMESALLTSFGFTPGKWLMSLRVENHLGKKLSTNSALIRTMRVWVLGMGMMNFILMILGHAVTLWFGLKKGAPLWDLQSGFRVLGTEMKTERVLFYWVLLAAIIGAFVMLVWPEAGPELERIQALVDEEMRRKGK